MNKIFGLTDSDPNSFVTLKYYIILLNKIFGLTDRDPNSFVTLKYYIILSNKMIVLPDSSGKPPVIKVDEFSNNLGLTDRQTDRIFDRQPAEIQKVFACNRLILHYNFF